MIVWRISEFADLSGRGGLLIDGRWSIKGRPIIYTAESSALAMLETLAGLQIGEVPEQYQLLQIGTGTPATYAEWTGAISRDLSETRAWGEAWLAGGKTGFARVPSVIAPHSHSWLINPLHPDAASAKIISASRWPWDKRLFWKA